VGVAENIHADGVNLPAPPTVYAHIGGGRGMTFAVRSWRAGTEGLLREIAAQIHAVNPNLPLARVRTLNDVYRQSMAQTSFALVLLAIAGAMALTLAIVGMYGVLAYAVGQRRHEVGIRLALGAEPKALKWLFVRRGLTLNCIGGMVGLAMALALSRWIASLLFGLTPLDPVTYAAAGGVIAVSATAASYIPARAAASVDPMETLRSE
jgi:ABC-type antimicrobial peptide transport system permease subunit